MSLDQLGEGSRGHGCSRWGEAGRTTHGRRCGGLDPGGQREEGRRGAPGGQPVGGPPIRRGEAVAPRAWSPLSLAGPGPPRAGAGVGHGVSLLSDRRVGTRCCSNTQLPARQHPSRRLGSLATAASRARCPVRCKIVRLFLSGNPGIDSNESVNKIRKPPAIQSVPAILKSSNN